MAPFLCAPVGGAVEREGQRKEALLRGPAESGTLRVEPARGPAAASELSVVLS